MVTIPILSGESLKGAMIELGPELEEFLRQVAEKFIRDNKADAMTIGEENAKAIMNAVLYTSIPIPELLDAESVDQILAREKACTKRDQMLALITEAQKENNQASARLIKNAGTVATSVGVGVLGMFLRALFGGV